MVPAGRPTVTTSVERATLLGMQQSIDVPISASPERVFAELAHLDSYPRWLDMIAAVERAEPAEDEGPAWWVTLRAKVGPFARSKRLRMVRTVSDEPTRLRFDRVEVDGRQHARWTLDLSIDAVAGDSGDAAASMIRAKMDYEGSLWTAPLSAILDHNLREAVPRLSSLLSD